MKYSLGIFLLFISFVSLAQVTLKYYLPDTVQYNSSVPTPKSVLGYEPGEWHISHDQLWMYMKELARNSDRIKLEEYGRTHENRPLVLLTFTSPANHKKLDQLRKEHLELCDPQKSSALNTSQMPVVVYLGNSVHGNEPSGANSSVLTAYFLAAAQGQGIDELLENSIILLDPCFNPDGLHRFSTWVNAHKGKNPVSDPVSREFNEPFPRGRTNHYWFDLNRDWLAVQQPELKARLEKYHQWKPNILTDHHEMGSNATFFFQPGVPSRVHPFTPALNQELTAEIARYHARRLDKIKSLYYTKEGFDDFYYGKGSTYPDINGGVGILFEQASSRGHSQETVNGVLTFPFTIRNQVSAAFSTLEAALKMRKKLLDFQRDFYKKSQDETGAYVFGSEWDRVKNFHFLEILLKHQIEVYELTADLNEEGKSFKKGKAWAVPLKQTQSKVIKAIFETQTKFQDSLFYDISSWTFPLAFHLPYVKRGTMPQAKKLENNDFPKGEFKGLAGEAVAYLFRWDHYYAPRALNRLLTKGIRAKVATQKATYQVNNESIPFDYGTILIPIGIQENSNLLTSNDLKEIMDKDGIDIYAIQGGLATEGVDYGSSAFGIVQKPEVLMIVGEGVNANDAGEVWHLLDQRYGMNLSQIEVSQLGSISLQRYNTCVMVSGNYAGISARAAENLKNWIRNGNTLIVCESAVQWANAQNLLNLKFKNVTALDSNKTYAYAIREEMRGAQELSGAIFEANLDTSHPLGYGFRESKIPVFKGNNLFIRKPVGNPFNTPLVFTKNPLLSGYISSRNLEQLKESVALSVQHLENGRVIAFSDNPNFRAFWFGTNKLFANALFFSKNIGR